MGGTKRRGKRNGIVTQYEKMENPLIYALFGGV